MSKKLNPDNDASRRVQRAIIEQKKDARERRNKIVLSVGGALIVIGLITYFTVFRSADSDQSQDPATETAPRHHTEVVIELPTEYEQYRASIETTAADWFDQFECVILDEVLITHGEDTRGQLDPGEWLLAYAEPGAVYLSAALLETGDQKMIGDTVGHELTHTCMPEYPTMLANPIKFSEGEIIGFHGLGILIRRPNGEETTYSRLDEGAAEANAVLANPDYAVDSSEYYGLQQFALSIKKGTDVEYIDYIRRNDVPGFVSLILKRYMNKDVAPDHLTGDDYDTVMSLYEREAR